MKVPLRMIKPLNIYDMVHVPYREKRIVGSGNGKTYKIRHGRETISDINEPVHYERVWNSFPGDSKGICKPELIGEKRVRVRNLNPSPQLHMVAGVESL